MTNKTKGKGEQTKAIHAGDEDNPSTGIASPIYQAAAYRFNDPIEISDAMASIAHPEFYGRYGTPNTRQLESTIAQLEGAEAALATGSGMAAISLVLLSLLREGDHIVVQRNIYPTTYRLINSQLKNYGIKSSFIDPPAVENFAEAISTQTKLVYLESPANPTLALTDIKTVSELAKSKDLTTIVDNTFATPHNQKPLALGADIVVQSATKYLGGHSDIVAGVIASSKNLIERFWRNHILFGSVLHPFEAWLLERGLKTFPIRMEQHNRNGAAIAEFLEGHEKVERVFYPGLNSHPQNVLARRQMSGGFGGMICFEIRGGWQAAYDLVSRVEIISNAVSLGGVHSLITHPASTISTVQSEREIVESGVSPTLVRLSVGLEDKQDLIYDLSQALQQS